MQGGGGRTVNRIRVRASKEYEVLVAPGLLDEAGAQVRAACPSARIAALVADTNVMPLYGARVRDSLEAAGLRVVCHTFPAGEEHKDLATYGGMLDFLVASRLSRSDVLVALGGGVTGDMAGFAAATYLRGIDYVQIPTTLLAAVDSSVGGKTAIDLARAKNQVGAFWQPSLVLCDPDTLRSQPEAVYREGCGEVVKYGMLGSRAFFDSLVETPVKDQYERMIGTCVTMKRDIVEGDEFDRGERRKLNLGHSIGHAVEQCAHYAIPHGCAVAIGMVMICRAACRFGYCDPEALDALTALLRRYDLPVRTEYGAQALYDAMLSDKKMAGGRMHLVVPEAVGVCRIVSVGPEELPDWLKAGAEE